MNQAAREMDIGGGGSAGRKPGAVRWASAALGLVLVLLSVAALSGAWFSYSAGEATKRATEISNAFAEARYSVGAEESLERKYRLEPSPEVRVLHHQAAASLIASLRRVTARGDDPKDLTLIADVLTKHENYVLAIDRLFAATDVGDNILASQIDASEVDPSFDAMQALVVGAASEDRAEAAANLENLTRIQSTVLIATPIVFIAGMGLVVFFGLLLRSYRRKAEESIVREATAIRRSEYRFRSLVQNASDVVLICSSEGLITYQSPTATSAWGYGEDALLGKSLIALVRPEDRPALDDLLQQLQAAPGTTRSTEVRLATTERDTWQSIELVLTNLLHEPGVEGLVATARDITSRKAFEEQLTHQAFYDSLTKLPNRVLFRDRLDQALTRAERRDGRVGLLFVDLDNFKQINDSLGHRAGDSLLIETAARLQGCVRADTTVARLGGDEFVVLLGHLLGDAEAVVVADRVIAQFNRPFQLDGRELLITASVGIAVGEAGLDLAENILRNADVAMYRAKSDGRGRRVMFDASMHTNFLAKLELENDLRNAIAQGDMRVHYQPIVMLDTGQVADVEALVRWQHPTRGLLAPAEFIGVAEETGLIVPLGLWVLEEACGHVARWQAEFPLHPPLKVSVNLSPRQFQQQTLIEDVKRVLRKTGLAPGYLTLEITEGSIMHDVEATITSLCQLKQLGIQIAIDDFGTGYSSLSYLKRLPLDVLKIDRSFVGGIDHDQEDRAITRAIISLAKSLNLSITGEGIETSEQSTLLQEWACDRGQGFLFAHPLDEEALAKLLSTACVAPHEGPSRVEVLTTAA